MAKNMWGKQPPKKQAYTPPTLNTPSFWGPAPVPPKVYQTWAAIRGEGRDGSEYEDPEGIDEGGAHDSWVSQFSKRFAIDPVNISGTGRDGTSPETEGRSSAGGGAFATGAGDDDGDGSSFETGEGDPSDIGDSDISGEGRDGSSPETEGRNSVANTVNIAGEGRDGSSPETEGRNSVANTVNISGDTRPDVEEDSSESLTYGVHDSWVTGFEKELASSTAGSVDPTVREQGAGGHDSWVSKFSQQIASDPFAVSGDGADGSYVASPVKKPPITPPDEIYGKMRKGASPSGPSGLTEGTEHDTWVNAFKKELVKSKGGSWRAPVPPQQPISSGTFKSGNVPSEKSPDDKFVGQWNFRVKVNGIPDDNCKLLSISGISSETEPIEFKRSMRQYVESIPGKYKYSNIELTKVMNIGGDSFVKWREQIEAGSNAFRTITIYLHHIDLKGAPVMTLTLHDAWPVKWEFPELSGSSSDAAVEKITLDVARITRG